MYMYRCVGTESNGMLVYVYNYAYIGTHICVVYSALYQYKYKGSMDFSICSIFSSFVEGPPPSSGTHTLGELYIYIYILYIYVYICRYRHYIKLMHVMVLTIARNYSDRARM